MDIKRQILDHKRNIIDQQRRLTLLLEEARKRLPEPLSINQIENMVAEEDHLLDAFYVSFEDHFRGTREDIKKRFNVYLPIIQEGSAGTELAPILDIGCGRGEWLELLQENGLVARGIDINRIMIGECQERNLVVSEDEAIAYLRGLKSNSLGAVTGMHIIEHIPFKSLVILIDEVLRVLKPSGIVVFESPNPENLVVGANNFYIDPTHLNPLPPQLVQFVVEARGFVRVRIERLRTNRIDDPFEFIDTLENGSEKINPMIKLAKQYIYAAPDYAVIAYKA